MDETWKFAIIICVSLLSPIIALGIFTFRQAHWAGKIEQKLNDLCNRVTRLENKIFNGGGKV